jgi:glutamine synthetase
MSEYRRLRAMFPDHLSIARGKYIPSHLAANGASFCITNFALTYDKDMYPTAVSRLLDGLPDMDLTYSMDDIRPSWHPNTDMVVGDVSFHGEPIQAAPRTVLKKAISDWKALGYDIQLGLETESFILQPTDEGAAGGRGWVEWDTPGAHVYGTGPFSDPLGLFDEIMETAYNVGLPVEAINTEYDSPSWEVTLQHADALTAVDNIFYLKLMMREIAFKHGLRLTFLGKPFGDRGGAGFHVNMSLHKDGKNAFIDETKADGISDLAKQCIAGQVEKHESMALFCASTVNAYKRLQPAQLAGYWANWGYDHRGVTVRVPHARGAGTRIENRMPDGACSPYYAAAAVLQASRLGVINNYALPAYEKLDCLESQSTDRHVPNNLGEACDAAELDKEFAEAFSADSVEQFVAVKRYEWSKYTESVSDWESKAGEITQWEYDHYLQFL